MPPPHFLKAIPFQKNIKESMLRADNILKVTWFRRGDMKKILIIDDEEELCSFIKLNLERREDFEVHVCTDSRGAIRWAKQLHPDLILLDIVMPGISGTDIARGLKNDMDTQKIPIVFLKGRISKEEAEDRQYIPGVDHIVTKPVVLNKMISMINMLT
jgi:CheY-like chemotaxis protein